jgi:formate hydrogenlyase subunit 5
MPASHTSAGPALAAGIPELWQTLARAVVAGQRLADFSATARPDGTLLTAHLAGGSEVATYDVLLPLDSASYPALTPVIGAAFWYEREIHDLFGIVPAGHPRLEPLLLPSTARQLPRPGAQGGPVSVSPDPAALPQHTVGPGLFTIPHGPVRSGVMESIEYLVETPGEDIPHLNMRVFYKHRGIEKRFEDLSPADGVLLAERAEGIAGVAHALAYCQALEEIAGVRVPRAAELIRVLHAELERLACHLDVFLKLADSAGLAVATARFGWHKEQVLRLVGQLCGSRFGRGVVVPGGVTARPQLAMPEFLAAVSALDTRLRPDIGLLQGTASFLDRLRRTGPLRPDRAHEHGALGPVGRASGRREDIRAARPYGAYSTLAVSPSWRRDGDALARFEVRADEIDASIVLLRQAAAELDAVDWGERGGLGALFDIADGRAVGWAEAPQGEVLYDVRVTGGRITRCRTRSASFHNLVLMHEVFAGDILTDFPFIEASFGLSVAGVAS